MLWEYLECAQNAVGIFKKQFDYQRIYDEFFYSDGNLANSGTSVTGV